MAFLDLNTTEGAPLVSIGGRVRATAIATPAPMWLRPRRAKRPQGWRKASPVALSIPAALIPAAYTADYLGDPLLGMLAATLLYAMAAPFAAWLAGDRGINADHTKI
ncbi:hypothetical protein [Edaphosphingomonas haloaromaticamans]|uniref:Uncharacterized protein n=1 Tax=Edaphosphingomonas haloaromaticamans TaxID=653954 RepID=A0A1S1HGH6_9SPHN|nr:hypothetical protein [Sphingomonas haloaromaticamans]OHT20942.1 hypothetical protein BHE75_02947 [Sphingomonas haloaromaticamans]